MSIDARVDVVIRSQLGSGQLILVDRPPSRPGDYPGIAGQRSLHFGISPTDVSALAGCDIWGGDGGIMLGEIEIAKRTGYTNIDFVVGSIQDAIQDSLLKKKGRADAR